jgi:ABC-type transporter Mla MlaB component
MLRITVHHNSQSVTFQLEGRLSRPWLQELDRCWRRTLVGKEKPALCVDLTGLTFVDDAGKACLAAMYHEGADFIADDCLTKSIVEEIRHERNGREVRHE